MLLILISPTANILNMQDKKFQAAEYDAVIDRLFDPQFYTSRDHKIKANKKG